MNVQTGRNLSCTNPSAAVRRPQMDATSLSRTMVDWDQVRLYNVSSARRLRVSRKKRTWPARDLKLGAFLVQHITLATVAAGVAPAVELWRRARRKKRAPKNPVPFACAPKIAVRIVPRPCPPVALAKVDPSSVALAKEEAAPLFCLMGENCPAPAANRSGKTASLPINPL